MADLDDLEKRIRVIEEKLGIIHEYPFKFEEIIDRLDKRTLMQIWQGLDSYRIAVSLVGLSWDQIQRMKETFSKHRWEEIVSELHEPRLAEITPSSIKRSRESILGLIIRLERMGEIVVGVNEEDLEKILLNVRIKKEEPKETAFDVQFWLNSTFEKV